MQSSRVHQASLELLRLIQGNICQPKKTWANLCPVTSAEKPLLFTRLWEAECTSSKLQVGCSAGWEEGHASFCAPAFMGDASTGRAKFFRAGGCFCICHRYFLVSWDLIWQRSPLGGYLRNRAWGRTGKDVVVCLIRKAIMKSGWRMKRGENSGSFLINPGSCWASSSSGMFRDAMCLNSLHLLMQ